ncbi:MAG: hypothetical protein K9H64_12955 [Bacteroidales bacterium]|nr:hypothetical protein [Bacteroidales bacterium]MCF8456956.1 hypothetical protein [Bacteroidales bacterium]
MKKFFFLCLIITLSGIVQFSSAQTLRNFSDEDEAFLKEMKNLLEKGNKKEGGETFDIFLQHWQAGLFTHEEQVAIKKNSNDLLKKRARAFPHFNNYLRVLIAFNMTQHDTESREKWMEAMDYMLTKRSYQLTKIDFFLETSDQLIRTNTIYASPSAKWSSQGADFSFDFTDDDVSIRFDSLDLACYAKGDSMFIYETSGSYFPSQKKWYGKKGTVTWEPAGYSPDSVFAKLNNYNIHMIRSTYDADSVIFKHLGYSKEGMLGSLTDKVMSDATTNRISYPKFSSYEKRLIIKDIYPGINYEGGFSMLGNKFLSRSQKGDISYLNFFRKDSLFMRVASTDFVFRSEYIAATKARIAIYLESDSIYHPGLKFRYITAIDEVQLTRTGEGMSRAPFYNTYHKVDMDFEQIIWKRKLTKLDFNMIKGGEAQAAVFESDHYFSANRYFGLQGLDKYHPYLTLAKYSKRIGLDVFYAEEYANYLGMSPTEVRQQLMRMSYLGVIDYDVDQEKVTVRDRLMYYLQAQSGSIDYDVISFLSNPNDVNNASLSLLTKDLKIHGVPAIQLSDSQKVIISPTNGEIVLKKNRDFDFEGKVQAGLFDFYGKKFSFVYNQFQISLENIDSLRIHVMAKDKEGEISRTPLKTVIEDISGNLLIDKPNNKSGYQIFPEYPIFNSVKNSYVYYDHRSIQSGVYKRDNFYFKIDPYSIDSLDDFSTKALTFDGNLTSADIFPAFDETLKIQPDLSLGFVRKTPDTGFAMYGTKGKYRNQIDLSHRGLRGDGEVEYLTSTTYCTNFLFYPDSTNAYAQRFVVKKQAAGSQFPSASGNDMYVHWEPKNDVMYSYTSKSAMEMYDEEALLTGNVELKPEGMTGKGFMEFVNAEMSANLYKYKANTFDSDSANFDLQTTELDGFAFRTTNVEAHVDFVQRLGNFKLNDDETFMEFPPNQYICSMDVFTWYMDKQEIDMSVSWLTKADKTVDMTADPFSLVDSEQPGSVFISQHPLQDSLRFVASLANYKIDKNLITAYNVRTITVADATILPGDGIVYVEKKAIMRTLEDAKIIANNDSKYHLLYDADVNIFGRKNYNAAADYDYIDEVNRKQAIHFDVVAVSDSITTYATGHISDSLGFRLSPNFDYQGNVKLFADREFLTFSGLIRMNYDCANLTNNWIFFKSEINPGEVFIPISEKPVNINEDELTAGIFLKKDSTHIYTSFLNKPEKYSDIAILPVSGFLYYDKISRDYMIGSREKIDNPDITGNLLKLNREKCLVEGDGKMDLGVYSGQVKINTAGTVQHDLVKDSLEFNVMMVLDFFFPPDVLQMMANAMYNSTALEPADLASETFIKGVNEFLGPEAGNEALNNLSLYGEYKKFPKEFEKSLVLTEVNLIWDSKTSAYVSMGPIGVGNVGKTEVNRYVDGKMEFVKTRTTNEFTIYLQLDYDVWYLFEYKRNNLFVVSSDDEFNIALKLMKPDKRRSEIKGEPPLTVVPANERKQRYFLQKFNLGDEMPQDDEEYEDEE